MNNQQKIPEGWKEVKLSKVGVLSKGQGISKSDITLVGNNAIRYAELYTKYNFVIKKIFSYISNETAKNATKINTGDIVFAGSGETIDEIGKSATYLINEPCFVGGDTIIFSPKNQNSSYLSCVLNTGNTRKKLRALGQGQSVVHIYKKDIENIIIQLPQLIEQNRIVEVLEAWDKYLEKLDQKIKLKKNIKKGLMQNLLTGKIRLKGFSDQWKNVLLKDISSFSKGQELSKSSLNENGKNECILYGELFTKYHEYSGSIISRTDENLGTPTQYGDILIPSSDVTPLGLGTATAIMKENVLIGGDINIIRPNKMTIDPLFLGYLLNQQKKKLLRLVTGTTIRHLYLSDIKKIVVSMPSLEEQNAIVKILTPLDKDIVLLKKQKEIIKNQKKYLLNNLITGQIRLPEFV